jgi:hypothetical protein
MILDLFGNNAPNLSVPTKRGGLKVGKRKK